ncbi:MAG: hypothetical protein O7B99_09990, partial [Planctomycetota bacterium]|nr:hypothetical protein [Planctomycetota bacterium]
ARALGARMMTEGGSDRSSRLIYGFRQCTSRMPTQQELIVLLRVVDEQLKHYAEDEQAAQAFVSVGESEPPEELDVKELAAWTAIGNLLLNLDAAIHRS